MAQRNDLMEHYAGYIRSGAQGRIADHIKIGKTSQPQRLTDAASSGAFNVQQEFGVPVRLKPQIQGIEQGGLILSPRIEAVGPRIQRVKSRMRLEDEVGLS